MPKSVEFFFDYASTFSYLAWAALPDFTQRTGARIVQRPMLLGGLWKTVGNHSPTDVPAKRAWLLKDMELSSKKLGIPFRLNQKFPVNSLHLMRGAMVAREEGYLERYSEAVFNALWRDDQDLGDPTAMGQVLAAAGIDGARLLARTGEPAIKDQLKASTDEAARRGAFGAPTFFVGDQMFWGHDRMAFVEDALAG
jgi:2-hydroxychromene-2-carboxylate isomerase